VVEAVVEVDIRNAYNGSEYADLEAYFRRCPGVTGVHLDRTRGVAHLGYDPAQTTPERLNERLARDGYRCDCQARSPSRAQTGHPQVGAEPACRNKNGGSTPPRAVLGESCRARGTRSSKRAYRHKPRPGRQPTLNRRLPSTALTTHTAGHGAGMVADLLRRFPCFARADPCRSLPSRPWARSSVCRNTRPLVCPMGLFGFLLATTGRLVGRLALPFRPPGGRSGGARRT
jgi:Cu2+-exporting ATPase